MCTVITAQGAHFYFGRNMDIERGFDQRVVLMPREWELELLEAGKQRTRYAVIGMAAVREDFPLYADGVNEKGLCMAGLHFPGNARYFQRAGEEKKGLSYTELIPYVLGCCATVGEAEKILRALTVLERSNPSDLPPSPLHWMLADKERAIVLEPMEEGLRIYDNPYGVLTNNPPFPFHKAELGRYCRLTPNQPAGGWSETGGGKPYSLGFGSMGLPGDYSSPSRFVKASYLRRVSDFYGDERDVAQMFRLLGAVAPVRGSVRTEKGENHFTVYSCCMDGDEGIYYYQTADDPRIVGIRLRDLDLHGGELKEFALRTDPDIAWRV